MAYSVEMPELGESVTEGTITQWLKSVGDTVEADEPLLEVSTDKVDTEFLLLSPVPCWKLRQKKTTPLMLVLLLQSLVRRVNLPVPLTHLNKRMSRLRKAG